MLTTPRKICKLAIAVFVAIVAVACQPTASSYTTIQGEALGTFVVVKCDAQEAQREAIIELIASTDSIAKASMSIFNRESLLSRINRNETDILDEHIAFNIALAERFSRLSDGAYDITIKPLTEAWGFAGERAEQRVQNIDSLLEFVGYEKIAVEGLRLSKEDSRVQIDLNSIAKGYTVDLVAEGLEAMGVESYMVNIGGEIRCSGKNSRGQQWSIGIETPYEGNFASDAVERIVRLTECGVATSGNYRRFYTTENGERVAHTLDPKSGRSVLSDLLSATVIAPTCAEADAAATMLMSLGSQRGAEAMAERLHNEAGWGYILIFADGEGYRITEREQRTL